MNHASSPRIFAPLILMIFLGLLAAMAPRPANGSEPLSLGEALDLALREHPLLSASRQEVQAAQAQVREAFGALYPKIEFSEIYSRSNQPVSAFGTLLNQSNFTTSDFAVDRLNDPDSRDNFKTQIRMVQPVFNGNREALGIRRAFIEQEMAEQNSSHTRQNVIFSVTEAFYGLILAEARLGLAREALQIAETNLKQVRTRYEQGLAVKSDLLGAEVNRADVDEQAIRAANEAGLARLALGHAIGIDDPVDAIGELTREPDGLPDLDHLKQVALERRPDYKALRSSARRADTDLDLARAPFLPNLNLQASYELNHRNFAGDGSDSYTVLALLSINLFNGMSDRARVARAHAERQRLASLVTERRRAIELEVNEAYLQTREAIERIRVREETVAQAGENLRIIRNRYQTGISTILELLTAEHLLAKAKTSRIQSLYDYRVARARLQLSTGQMDRPDNGEAIR